MSFTLQNYINEYSHLVGQRVSRSEKALSPKLATSLREQIAAIEEKAEALAIGQGVFKDMSVLMLNLRVALSGKDYIFCLLQNNALAIILTILYERMDAVERLKHRLL